MIVFVYPAIRASEPDPTLPSADALSRLGRGAAALPVGKDVVREDSEATANGTKAGGGKVQDAATAHIMLR